MHELSLAARERAWRQLGQSLHDRPRERAAVRSALQRRGLELLDAGVDGARLAVRDTSGAVHAWQALALDEDGLKAVQRLNGALGHRWDGRWVIFMDTHPRSTVRRAGPGVTLHLLSADAVAIVLADMDVEQARDRLELMGEGLRRFAT